MALIERLKNAFIVSSRDTSTSHDHKGQGNSLMSESRPDDTGILAIEVYFPAFKVRISEAERARP